MPKFQAIKPIRPPLLSDINPHTLGEEVTLDKQLENSQKKDTYYNRKKISDAVTWLIVTTIYVVPICAIVIGIRLMWVGQLNTVIDGLKYIVVFLIGSIVSPHLKNLMNIGGSKEVSE